MKIKKLNKHFIYNQVAMIVFLSSLLFMINESAIAMVSNSSIKKVTKKAVFGRIINCNSISQISAALASAQAGDEIIIASGVYNASSKVEDAIGKFVYFTSNANGTAANPIILRGASAANKPVLRAAEANKYGATIMSITGDYWIIKDLELSQGQKGLTMDTANHCQLLNLSVNDIGDEGIHLRSGSSDNLVQNCSVFNVGVRQPGFGEGIYIGSDEGQHDTYTPNCDRNTINNCVLGPNIRAEAIDVKEGTQFTVIKNCTISGAGISGANSADAFIDIKGGNAFIYNNTFNIDGSTVIASGLDFQQRNGTNSGFRIAVFNNTYNLGSRASNIPTCRKKGGDPSQVHVWNNTRNPSSEDFPISDGTLRYITQSCPSWNIIPCGGGTANLPPSVSITSPANGASFTTGATITINASASDSDGTIAKVEFFRGSTKLGEDTSSPYQYNITSAANGTYAIMAKATDDDNASSTSGTVNVTVSTVVVPPPPPPTGTACSFGTPTAAALPSFDRITFLKMYVLGTGGPSATNLKSLKINWNLGTNTLTQFAYNTDNGVPEFYVDLRSKITQNFSATKPAITITNSGYPGLDGDYWVTKKGLNFVMVSKTRGFTLYFSNDNAAPACSASRLDLGNEDLDLLRLYPNPSSEMVNVMGITVETTVMIMDMQGKVIVTKMISPKETSIDVSSLKSGVYIVTMESSTYSQRTKLNISK
jgi:endoglucanase